MAEAAEATLWCLQQRPATLPAPPGSTRGHCHDMGGVRLFYQQRCGALALAVGVRVRVLVVAPVALRLVSSGARAKASEREGKG